MKEYIVSGTYHQANHFAKSLGLAPQDWTYIHSMEYLLGLENISVTFCGGYKYRPDFKQILEILTTMRNVTIRKEVHMRDLVGELL